MLYSRSNVLTGYLQPNIQSYSVQRQRSFIQRSNLFSTDCHQSSTPNRTKRDLERQSPVIIRRHRPTIENLSVLQQSPDVSDVLGNQIQLTLPPHSTSRHRSPRPFTSHTKLLNYSKALNEGTINHILMNAKSAPSLQPSIWTPSLTEKETTHTRIHRSRTPTMKYHHSPRYQLQSDKNQFNTKQPFIPDLYISTRSLSHDCEILKKSSHKSTPDDWEDPKSNVAVLSDEEESIVTNCNGPILTYNPHYDHFASSGFLPYEHLLPSNGSFKLKPIKQTNLRRSSYDIVLPPVFEHEDDEELNDDSH